MKDKYTVVTDIPPSPKEYNDLRLEGGVSGKSLEGAAIGLKNSLFAIFIYDNKVLVGMGRVIGDGGTVYHVVDIVVKPSYQRQGIGNFIMERITNYLEENAYPGSYVSLIADAPADKLYERFGFKYSYPNSYGMYRRY